MIIDLFLYTTVAAITPRLVPGVRVDGLVSAIGIAIVYGVFNLILGGFLTLVVTVLTLPLKWLTFGLFSLLIPAFINAALLRLTDSLLDSFHLDGWIPAIGMGLLFSLAGIVAGLL